jgi:pimeloyl-ACP methyl ester carboxylesterase
MSAVLFDERIVHYEVLGRGRPVIFLHGWVGSWRYWIPAMQTVAISFRAYALDLWGFGDTTHDTMSYALDRQAGLLERFLHEMGIGKVAIVGHGLGALVALLFARKCPGMVDRILLVDVPLEPKDVAARLRSPASPADLTDWLLNRDPISDPVRADAAKSDTQAIIVSMNNLSTINFPSIVNQLQIPCLFTHGQNDPAIALPDENWQNTLPMLMHYIPLEQSGHFPMLDESSLFNRLMGDFLGLESGISPRDLQLKDEWKRRVR